MDLPTHNFHWQTGQRTARLFCFAYYVKYLVKSAVFSLLLLLLLILLMLPAEKRLFVCPFPRHSIFLV